MADHSVDQVEDEVRISDAAARRISALIGEDGTPGMMFRVSVSGGGCSGFQYGFSIDDAVSDDDRVFADGGVSVVVDEASLGLLDGAELDYVEELIGAYFTMKNPNASTRCGCGSSFSV